MTPRQKKNEPPVEPTEEVGSSAAKEISEFYDGEAAPLPAGVVPTEDWEARILADAEAGARVEALQIELEEVVQAEVDHAENEQEVARVRTFWDDVIRRMGGDPDADQG